MDTGDHPEVDDTDMLFGSEITIYQIIIGCALWEITLGIYYVQYETNDLARFGAATRKWHTKKSIRIFVYLRYNDRRRTMFEIEYKYKIKVEFKYNDCIDLYKYKEEAIT